MMTTYFFTAFTQQSQWSVRRGTRAKKAAGWLSRLRRSWVARSQYRHLEDLPDYLLDDIGLTRGDIARARRGEFPY